MEFLNEFWIKSWAFWVSGGGVMIPLFFISLLAYFTAFELYFEFNHSNFLKVTRSTVDDWVQNPQKAEGEVGHIIRYTQTGLERMEDLRTRFAEVRASHLPGIDRRVAFLSVLVSVAPLLGLLGTVTGMLATFDALTKNVGRTMDLVAGGISEALITTETGLVIAIPGYVIIFLIVRRRGKLEQVLTHLESKSIQKYQRSFGNGAPA